LAELEIRTSATLSVVLIDEKVEHYRINNVNTKCGHRRGIKLRLESGAVGQKPWKLSTYGRPRDREPLTSSPLVAVRSAIQVVGKDNLLYFTFT
jgi:hypothetical protein